MSTDIVDRIDELVDASLADGEPETGYDFGDQQYPKCPHCERHWHGLPITNKIANMYSWGNYDPDYSYADDDSGIICEGSDFIGPQRPPHGWGFGSIKASISVTIGFNDTFSDTVGRLQQWITDMYAQLTEDILLPSFSFGVQPQQSWVFRDSPRRGNRGPIVTYWDEAWNVVDHEPISTGPLPEVDITFGPQNWHYEFQYIPQSNRYPTIATRNDPPAQAIRHHWDALTAPAYPIPESPGYDFSEYDKDIQHGPEAVQRKAAK